MAWHHELRSALGSLLGRRREERELDEELRFHVEMEASRHQAAGMPPDEARRRALRDFGGVERHKEGVRDERGTRWLEDAAHDVRFAARALRRRRGFTAVAALTLALGIGATTTLFGVVKAVLLTPLPWDRPETLAAVWSRWEGFDRTWLSYDEWELYATEVPAFASIALYGDGALTFGAEDEPERVRAGFVQAHLFATLGVAPLHGRGFTPEEDVPDGARVVVLGHGLWQRRFGGDASVLGRSVDVNGAPATVVGVMPPGFRLPRDFGADGATEAWMPLATDAPSNEGIAGPALPTRGGNHNFYGVARLAPGATIAQANAQVEAIARRAERDGVYPAEMRFRPFALAVTDDVTGAVRPALLLVFTAVGFVLLIACANVAGLLLVRGEQRRRERGVRGARAAGGRRLARLLLAESLVLAAVGGGIGVALAAAGTWLVRRSAPAALPRVADAALDGGVLLFAAAMALAAAVLAGLLPALHASQIAPSGALKDGGRTAGASAMRLRWRQALVAGEIAMAVVLVAGAGLMIRSVANLFGTDSGFRPEQVLTMRLTTPDAWYADPASVARFHDELQRRVAALPGVRAAGAARLLPLATEMGNRGIAVEGYAPPPGQFAMSEWQVVTPGYFDAMGLRLVEGRLLEARDAAADAPLAMVVSRAFARRYFDGRPALGGRVIIGRDDGNRPWFTVVGVVDDVRHNGLTGEVKPHFYATIGQYGAATGTTARSMSLAVRTTGDPLALAGAVRATVRELDPRLPVSEVRTMEQVVAESIAEPRFAMELLGLFGLLALVLSAIGIFGIVSQVVASRTHEFGIRAALGARPADLVRLSLGAGVRQAVVGLVAGLVLALLLTRAMTGLLHDVAPTDPLTFGAVVLVTAAVTLLASAGPARRAGKVEAGRVLQE